jgi:hypothetical protein
MEIRPMLIEPESLIQESIENLEALSVYFKDEIDERTHDAATLTLQARKCKEALFTISILMPKLREICLLQAAAHSARQLQLCVNCD